MDIEKLANDKTQLSDLSIVELRMRLVLVTTVLREAREAGDERYERLIPQQRRLNDALVARLKVERGEIAPTVVSMKTVKLNTKAPGV